MHQRDFKRVLLLYSGGLDTSCMIKWLQEKCGAEVVTLTLDLGQGGLEKANGLYQGQYPLSTAIARPLMSKLAVEFAQREKVDAVSHGCTGKGNDQVRIEISIAALAPDLRVLAPVREWNMSREQEMEYAKRNNIPVPVDIDSPYSVDANLWGRSIECGVLEDPAHEPPKEIFELVTPPEEAADEPMYVELDFEAGLPVALNGKAMHLVELITSLNGIAGRAGVALIDMTEDRVVGLKSREIYECPAAVTILAAHRDLEKYCCTIHENEFKPLVDQRWAELAYKGLWYDPLMADLEAFINKVNEKVNGSVRLKLYKGSIIVVGRRSPNGLYDLNLATYEAQQMFDQRASEGFIELWGLPTKTAQKLTRSQVKQSKRSSR